MDLAILLVLAGCGDPYRHWPDPAEVFPAVYTPEAELESYEAVRWETETWDPVQDAEQAGLYLLKAANHRPGAPVESLVHFAAMRGQLPPLTGGGTRLSLVGDILPMGSDPQLYPGLADQVAHLLDGDLRIGNLETPTSPDEPTELDDLPGLYTFNAPTTLVDALPLDVLQLNNNHSLDLGDAGLEATVAVVEERGFTVTGVDTHPVLSAGGRDVAVLSYTWGLNNRDEPTVHDLFVVPFGHIGEPLDLEQTRAQIAAARGQADSVVVLLHWGFEYEYYPDPHFMGIARDLVAAGADVVAGHGPHTVQPAERCEVNRPEVSPGVGTCSVRSDDGVPRTAVVLHSLGNFATMMPTVPCQVGLVATVELDPDVVGVGWQAVVSLDDPGNARLAPLDDLLDDEVYAGEAARLDAHLGATWRR